MYGGKKGNNKNLSQDSQRQNQDLNLGLPKYEAGVQTTTVNQSIIWVIMRDV
jgi:hypothetical protein